VQIAVAAAVTGPATWPIAIVLLNRQQGLFQYRFIDTLRSKGVKLAFAGCGPYTSYKLFGIGTQRGVQVPVQQYLFENNPRLVIISWI
jgi:hypothetical protein